MYDELIKRLRNEAETERYLLPHSDNGTAALLDEAADAIEELSKDLDSMNEANIALYGALPKWIPVTEDVPDDRRDVQITVFWHDAWRTMYGYYDGAFWHLYAPMHTEVADVEVIGWMEKSAPMPFPKPLKEGE